MSTRVESSGWIGVKARNIYTAILHKNWCVYGGGTRNMKTARSWLAREVDEVCGVPSCSETTLVSVSGADPSCTRRCFVYIAILLVARLFAMGMWRFLQWIVMVMRMTRSFVSWQLCIDGEWSNEGFRALLNF